MENMFSGEIRKESTTPDGRKKVIFEKVDEEKIVMPSQSSSNGHKVPGRDRETKIIYREYSTRIPTRQDMIADKISQRRVEKEEMKNKQIQDIKETEEKKAA